MNSPQESSEHHTCERLNLLEGDSGEPIAEGSDFFSFTPREGLVLSQLDPEGVSSRAVTGAYFTPLEVLKSWQPTTTGLTAEVDGSTLTIDFVDVDVARIAIFTQAEACLPATPAVIQDRSSWEAEFAISETEQEVTLSTDALRIVIGKWPFKIESFRPDGSPVSECPAVNGLGSFSRLNDEFIVTRTRPKGSSILGLGQKTGHMDRSGKPYILWNTDVLNPRSVREFGADFLPGDPRRDPRSREFDPYYISIPFYYSLDADGRAAGFFIDNLHRAQYDFSQEAETRIQFKGGAYVEYMFAGPDLPSILKGYSRLTGRIKQPPVWSLGYHHCRWHPYNSDDVLRHARKYRERNIPCDSFWLDIDHMNAYRVFTWNSKLFPEPTKTLADLTALGFRSVTIVDPGVKVEAGNPIFESGVEKKAFCVTEQGAIFQGQVWPGRTAFPDFATEPARDWWGDLNAQHIQLGLSGIWNDMNEPATGDIPDSAMRFGNGKYFHGAYHNGYATLMAMGTYQGLTKAMPNRRPFILSRAGSAGIQRYAANWLGDSMSRWEHLAMSIPMSLGLGLSGQPFIGGDVGGFGENCTPELLVRWFQAACLTPFCRNHNDAGGIDQYPWSFGEASEALCRDSLHLRYRLIPYLYTAFAEAAETGAPIMRPMVWADAEDIGLRTLDDQYLLGSDLLVAPIVTEGTTSRTVIFPKGEWFDWWSDELVGAKQVSVDAPLNRIPLFARSGSIIPMWTESPPTTMNYHPDTLDLQVFVPSTDGTFHSRLVEDDGESFNYEHGERLITDFQVVRHGNSLTLKASSLGDPHPNFRRNKVRIHFRGASPKTIHTVEARRDGFIWKHSLG